jgi:type II secretory pathway predicted ATPase ExeA
VFRGGQAPATVFLGGQYGRGLEDIKQALAAPGEPALVLLTAPDGCGKSTLLGRLVEDLDEARLTSRVRGPFEGPEDFLLAALVGFGFEETLATRHQLRHILQAFLLHQVRQGSRPILIVEDTPSLKPQVLAELLWVAQLTHDGPAVVDIVMSGLPGLQRIVSAPAMSALATRRQQLVELQPMDVEETAHYIQHRLSVAGVPDPEGVFEMDAISLVHDLTGGIAGLVDTLCQTAIACAASTDEAHVVATAVTAAAGKLQQVSVGGVPRVQGSRRSDTKAVTGGESGHLVVTQGGKVVCEHQIQTDRVLIGRRPENDVRLDYPTVSAYHALLLKDSDGWVLIDLHSTNGTMLSSRSIRQHRLRGHETFVIANLEVRCSGLSRPRGRPEPTPSATPQASQPATASPGQEEDHAATMPRLEDDPPIPAGKTPERDPDSR